MPQNDDQRLPPTPVSGAHWREESHAFIVRVRITTAPQGAPRRPHFSLEDVSAGETSQHRALGPLLDQLSARITTIIAPPSRSGCLE